MTMKIARCRWVTLLIATVMVAVPAALTPSPAQAGGTTVTINGTICYEWESQMNFGPYVTLELSEPVDSEVMVYLTTIDGTARAPHDYIPFTPTLKVVIPPQTSVAMVRLRIVADHLREPDEYFLVVIQAVIGAVPANTFAEVIIRDGGHTGDLPPQTH